MANGLLFRDFIFLSSLSCSLFTKGWALSCYQCKNYPTFFASPQLNTLDCTNSSNYVEVTCQAGTKFCLKLQGAVYGSASASPQPNSLDGIQRGCASDEVLKIFNLTGNAYREGGNCQKGDKYIKIAYTDTFFSNLTPTYKFSGIYCYCQGNNCNSGSTVWPSSYLLLTMVLLQAFVSFLPS